MKTRVRKSGEMLTIDIPRNLADQTGMREDLVVDLQVINGRIVIDGSTNPNLAELLGSITPDNVHSEWNTGEPIGAESW